jgi:hypothetical protein
MPAPGYPYVNQYASLPGYMVQPGYAAPAVYAQMPGYANRAQYGAPHGAQAAPGAGLAPIPQQANGNGAANCPANGSNACSSGCEDPCCRKLTWQFFGEYLYLRPRNAEVPFAVPINGPIVPPPTAPVETGPVALLDPDYHSGYRVGFGRYLDCWTSVGGAYTWFESRTRAQADAQPRHALRSLIIHPSTLNTAGDFQQARSVYDLNFELADLVYRCSFAKGCNWSADYIVGARYGHLEQYTVTDFYHTGIQRVGTTIDFDGAGPMVGLAAERAMPSCGFLVYGRTAASFLCGEFAATYQQTDAFGDRWVDTAWKAGRVVPLLELEIGAGYVSSKGAVRLTAGYLVSAWYNTVKTADWIDAVQRTNFLGLSDAITFDGLVARAEVRF